MEERAVKVFMADEKAIDGVRVPCTSTRKLAESRPSSRVFDQGADRVAECSHVVGGDEDSHRSIREAFGVAAHVRRNYRLAGCHGFEKRVTHSLGDRWENEKIKCCKKVGYTGDGSKEEYAILKSRGLNLLLQGVRIGGVRLTSEGKVETSVLIEEWSDRIEQDCLTLHALDSPY